MKTVFVPVTKNGSCLAHLSGQTANLAWRRLEWYTGSGRKYLKLAGYSVEEMIPANTAKK